VNSKGRLRRWVTSSRTWLFVFGLIFTWFATIVVIVGGYVYEWEWTDLAERTFWDWLKLLVAALTTAVIGYLGYAISTAQYRAQEQRAQDEALQTYLDHMGQLLLDKDPPLRQSKEDSEVRTLARAWTLTLLARLDAGHKAQVVQFLYESDLITADRVIVDLKHADLSGAILMGAHLSKAYMFAADLRGARLQHSDLSGADLSGANLNSTNLSDANLSAAILGVINPNTDALILADLSGADLRGANLEGAPGDTDDLLVQAASLKGATMPNGQKYEDWLKSKGSREDGENSSPS
jgi:hypothetical protein